MKREELIQALNCLKVQTGSLACLGCGYEHNCTTKGCRIIQDRVTEDQAERLSRCAKLGGLSFVLCQFASGQVYKLPWSIWENMQEQFGVKYITEETAAPYRCRLTARVEPLFLE